jgi:hypothetical protein
VDTLPGVQLSGGGSGGGGVPHSQWQRKLLVLLAGAVMAGVLLELAYSYKESLAARMAGMTGLPFRQRLGGNRQASDDLESVALVATSMADRPGSPMSRMPSPTKQLSGKGPGQGSSGSLRGSP